MNSTIYAIILCGGEGKRFQSDIPKQFLKINDIPIFELTLKKFNENINIDKIIVVINEKYKKDFEERKISEKFTKVVSIVSGGDSRRKSVYNGLKEIKEKNVKLLVHDSVRPFVSHKTINRCIEALDEYEAVYPAIPTADTIVKVDNDFFIDSIPVRKYMMIGQTPQGFKLETLNKAHLLANNDPNVDIDVTNDCGLIQKYNLCKIKVVEGNRENIKITFPEDLVLLKKVFDKVS